MLILKNPLCTKAPIEQKKAWSMLFCVTLVLLHNRIFNGQESTYLFTWQDGLVTYALVEHSERFSSFFDYDPPIDIMTLKVARIRIRDQRLIFQEKTRHGDYAVSAWHVLFLTKEEPHNLLVSLSDRIRAAHIVECIPGQTHRSKRCPTYLSVLPTSEARDGVSDDLLTTALAP